MSAGLGRPDPGRRLLVLQIDGLARPVLESAIAGGQLPALAGLLERGSHRLFDWCPGLPSQTSASQAGLLFGDGLGIPAFRWFEKDAGRLMVSNHPGDAAEIERRARGRPGLLLGDGSSVSNLLSGGARLCSLTASTLDDPSRVSEANGLLTSPRFWSRELGRMAGEMRREVGQAARARLERRRPRVRRGGSYPFLRAVSTVLLRDVSTRIVAGNLARGVAAVYVDFVGYDEVAHHSGPATADALDVLARLDPLLARLLGAAERRGYQAVVLSDHGQSSGSPFRQAYGTSLEGLVAGLAGAGVTRGPGTTEDWGHVNRVLSELVGLEHVVAHLWRLLLRPRLRDGYVETGPDRRGQREQPEEIVVCASGNLGHVYLTRIPGRADAAQVEQTYPRLIDGLAHHAGIDFVVVRKGGRPVALGPRGCRWLDSGEVEGDDPLAPFEPDAADHLRALAALPHAGDLILNGHFDPAAGTVAAFEELVGSHGGLGGDQTTPFLLAPADWDVPSRLDGAPAVHALLRDHLPSVSPGGTDPAGAASSATAGAAPSATAGATAGAPSRQPPR